MIVVTIVVRRKSGENSSPTLGRRSVPAARFCGPDRRLGQERPNDDQRQCRNQPRHQRIAPGGVAVGDFAAQETKPTRACAIAGSCSA